MHFVRNSYSYRREIVHSYHYKSTLLAKVRFCLNSIISGSIALKGIYVAHLHIHMITQSNPMKGRDLRRKEALCTNGPWARGTPSRLTHCLNGVTFSARFLIEKTPNASPSNYTLCIPCWVQRGIHLDQGATPTKE